ncbi:MAG: hypothetical protein K6G29_00040 [Clostridiales bacterium]|nr:hypothetical protein [Clostridiales bacterium]
MKTPKQNKKRANRGLSLLSAVLLLLTGCGKKEGDGKTNAPSQSMRDPVIGESAPMENATTLTGIYRAAEVYRYEGEHLVLSSGFAPLYDTESGKLTVFSRREESVPVTDKDGNPVYLLSGISAMNYSTNVTLRTLLPDGECTASIPLPMPDSHRFHHGGITENGVWYLTYDTAPLAANESKFALHCMNLDGSEYRSVFAAGLFGNAVEEIGMYNLKAAVFPDGSMIATVGNELAVLDEELQRRYSVASDGAVVSLSAAREDGGCLFLAGEAPSFAIWRLGSGDRQPELYASLTDYIGSVIFGPGADYYLADNDGIRAVTGKESVLLLNRQNSALPQTLALIGAVAPGVFVFYDLMSESEEDAGTVTLYRRADDVDLSSVKVIEVANAMFGTNRDIEEKITRYNREHPETRIVFTDVLDENESVDTRFDRLCFNVVNGFYTPDIILANNGRKIVDVMIEKKLYRDLTPYLENDAEVRLDDLFGMVRSYFTDRDGGLWGLSPTFTLRALTGRSDTLGKYAQKGSWTLDEALDFLESRPNGSVGIEDLTQENWTDFLLGPSGCGRWIDYNTGTCHFDRADFGRMLRYLKTLPKDSDEFMRRASFWAGMSADEQYNDFTPYRDGTIALQSSWYQSILGVYELQDRFGTVEDEGSELTCVGFPSDDGNDALQFTARNVCMITSYCSDPDAAWDLIRTFFDDPEGYGGISGDAMAVLYADGFPALKSAYDRQADVLSQYYMTQVKNPGDTFMSVTMQLLPADGSEPTPPKNGRAVVFGEALIDGIRSLLDGASLTPYVNYTPPEIEEIVFEEVSAYLGGGADAESCVKHIQSRVSIWLAEQR